MGGAKIKKILNLENRLLENQTEEFFEVPGYCSPCRNSVKFIVDMKSGGQQHANGWTPNWRERLECPDCHMINRQRLITHLIRQRLAGKGKATIYFMEQVTPIFAWAKKTFPSLEIIGSEYLGYEYKSGDVVNGIRHEDVENLSFEDRSIDLIISNDVFEHVPEPKKAFAECARVLSSGGEMLATIPFHSQNAKSEVRARLVKGKLESLLPDQFHGNPVSAEGSLVFTDFGWDILDEFTDAGFDKVGVELYASKEFGHLGGAQVIFSLKAKH